MDQERTEDYGPTVEAVEIARPPVLPWVLAGLAALGGAAAALLLWLRLEDAGGQAAEARAALASAAAERAELAQRLERIEAEKADLLALRNELSVQVQAKEEELQKLQGTYEELEAKMRHEIAEGDVRLSQAGGRIKVDLVDRILFDVGDASISERGGEVLSRVGAVLAGVQEKKIQVSGHTDDLPISERLRDRYPTNWELAAARASNVVRFLEEQAGVPGRRLVAAAYGPFEPISSNRTASGRARNRRIEIVLTPALAPAPVDGAVAAAAPAAASPKAAAKPAAVRTAAVRTPVKSAAAPAKKVGAATAAKQRRR